MKKCLMMMVVMLMASTMMFAQQKKGGHRKHDNRLEKMKTELKLSDSQYATIKGIDEKYKTKRDAVRADSAKTRDERGNALKALRAEQWKEVDAVLTADQKATRDKLRTEHAAARKEHFEKVSAEREAKLKSELGLNDDQSARLKAAHQQFRDKMTTLRKDGNKDKAAFKKAKADHDAAVKSILTPEQYKKWTELRAQQQKGKKHHGPRGGAHDGDHDRRG